MCIKNRIIALIYRLALVISCGYGLYINSGLPEGSLNPNMFVFYTILSNLVCFIFFVIVLIKTIMDIKNDGIHGTSTPFPRFKGAVTMMITVTFLIFYAVLAPNAFSMADASAYLWSAENLLVHLTTPLLVLFDWILFDRKGAFRKIDPILWLSIPYIYWLFAIIRAQLGGPIQSVGEPSRYPYFFIDSDLLGWGKVILYVAAITVFFSILGYIFYLFDHLRIRNGKLRLDHTNPK